ncbi:molecular chaperone TorD family protein [Vibrio owensii]|uniref:molecular chaperone TorD family protein n=1 Tax=Vibrio owensii TaxID=696485 RepID=UPI000A9441A1|nr:molecular chaperone TorD family protein [Vibrio owensii]
MPEWIEVINEPQQYAALRAMNRLTDEQWQQHFGMEQILTAPPWGSVYTDPEQVLYGATTVALQAELDSMGIEFKSEVKEPVDHIGLILMVMANIAQSNDLNTLERFQESHLMPWLEKYLSLLTHSVSEPIILAISVLLQSTLNWQDKS